METEIKLKAPEGYEEIVTFIAADPENRFTGLPPRTDHIDGPIWELVREVTYRTEAGKFCTVNPPFRFDWASVPWLLRGLYPPQGTKGNPYGIAAIFHDWLLKHKKIAGRPITRREADDLFYEIMIYTGVRKSLAYAMWLAVSANTALKKINPLGEK